ncbi:hypothetical protein ACFWWC_28995 [Streptomyces sp. NPDC058642]|uniref:hypothetical protein n=1 Tax=Streptomyces sp. NPDC058642 TaxID=3346572 RepID=UPI003662501D
MTPAYAVEILLTRPATHRELQRAREHVRLAANADRARLMAIQSALSPGHAMHVLRRRLGTRMPIDILTTHYPDGQGKVQLNIALTHSADTALRRTAAARRQVSAGCLGRCVAARLVRHEEERARHLEGLLANLLARHTLKVVLLCAARARPRWRHGPS